MPTPLFTSFIICFGICLPMSALKDVLSTAIIQPSLFTMNSVISSVFASAMASRKADVSL